LFFYSHTALLDIAMLSDVVPKSACRGMIMLT